MNPSVRPGWMRFKPRVQKPKAAPLLLIHGFGCGMFDWGPLPKLLAGKSERTVITFNNRGVGGQYDWAPEGPHSVSQMAADALTVVDEAGAERVSVMGMSLGGLIAQQLALEHPERISALILAGTTHGGREATPPPPSFMHLCQRWADHLRPNEDYESVDAFLAAMMPSRHVDGRDRTVRAKFLRTPRTSVGLNGQLAAMGRFNSTKRLGEITCPTLVVGGSLDQVMVPANSESLAARIPRARRLEWEDAGHFFWSERTLDCVKELTQFLAETDEDVVPR